MSRNSQNYPISCKYEIPRVGKLIYNYTATQLLNNRLIVEIKFVTRLWAIVQMFVIEIKETKLYKNLTSTKKKKKLQQALWHIEI